VTHVELSDHGADEPAICCVHLRHELRGGLVRKMRERIVTLQFGFHVCLRQHDGRMVVATLVRPSRQIAHLDYDRASLGTINRDSNSRCCISGGDGS